MKTTSKLFTAITILGLTIFISMSFKNQNTNNRYLTVRTFEVSNGIYDSKVVTIYEDGRTEEVELEKLRPKNVGDNGKKINEVLNNVSNKGYSLVSSNGGAGDGYIVSSYIFIKN